MTLRRITEPAPEFQTAEDKEIERRCMAEFAAHYGGNWRENPQEPGPRGHPRVDYDSDTAVAEFKSRVGRHGGKPLYSREYWYEPFLAVKKFKELILRGWRLRKVPIYVVEFVDALGYAYVWTVGPKTGMTNNRIMRVAQDNEPTLYIPISHFNWVRREG